MEVFQECLDFKEDLVSKGYVVQFLTGDPSNWPKDTIWVQESRDIEYYDGIRYMLEKSNMRRVSIVLRG